MSHTASRAEVARLRELLRDRRARDDAGLFVAEGPRVLDAALDHGAAIEAVYAAPEIPAVQAVVARATVAGIDVIALDWKTAARIGDTVTPQPVFAVVRKPRPATWGGVDLAVIGAPIGDPGNVGTLMRSAVAAGAQAIGLGAGSVDAYNPKVVRASAGACFAIRIMEGEPAVNMLAALGAHGIRRVGAVATGGSAPEALDFRAPVAFVLGHEAHGLAPDLALDEMVTIPMAAGESLNVAMAGTVLLFEAARQRRMS